MIRPPDDLAQLNHFLAAILTQNGFLRASVVKIPKRASPEVDPYRLGRGLGRAVASFPTGPSYSSHGPAAHLRIE